MILLIVSAIYLLGMAAAAYLLGAYLLGRHDDPPDMGYDEIAGVLFMALLWPLTLIFIAGSKSSKPCRP